MCRSGRGTDRPFEMVGAPWIEPRRFAEALREDSGAGVDYIPVFFTPDSSTNAGERCGGVNIVVTDRSKFHSVRLGLNLIGFCVGCIPMISSWEARIIYWEMRKRWKC